jgi:hypothetical protein
VHKVAVVRMLMLHALHNGNCSQTVSLSSEPQTLTQVTTVRTLLTPHPMKEIRVKGEYVHHKVTSFLTQCIYLLVFKVNSPT